MEYNSDFDVRLATLGALGGNTAITYDSVYDIDLAILEAIEQGGGGGGMSYDQMKQLLAASGVTEILFSDESGHTVTLDYEMVGKLEKGGNYICVDSLDELSGVTAQDGMLAYIKQHTAQEERLVVVTDFYDYESNDHKLYINIEWNDSNTTRINEWYGGNNAQINDGYGRFVNTNSDYFDDIHNRRSYLPTPIEFNNGATGTFISNVDGESFPDHWEMVNTFWFDKFDGEYPTITFTTDESEGMVVVTTSATVETVTVSYPAKGVYRYSAAANKWLAYEVNYGALTQTEINQMINDYGQYRNEVYIVMPRLNEEPYDNIILRLNGISKWYSEYYDCAFFNSDLYGQEGNLAYTWRWFRNQQLNWYPDNFQRDEHLLTNFENTVRRMINNKITSVSENEVNLEHNSGGLYNVAIEGTFSGTVYSTTFTVDTGGTNLNEIYHFDNKKNGMGFSGENRLDGMLRTKEVVFTPTTSTGWTVIDYIYAWNDAEQKRDKNFVALRYIDNQNDTITVDVFVSDANMHQEDGHYDTDFYSFYTRGNDYGYIWTVTTGQTVSVERTLYGFDAFVYRNQDNNEEVRPKLYKVESTVEMYDGSKKKIRIMTESAYESLLVKDNNVIYYLTED